MHAQIQPQELSDLLLVVVFGPLPANIKNKCQDLGNRIPALHCLKRIIGLVVSSIICKKKDRFVFSIDLCSNIHTICSPVASTSQQLNLIADEARAARCVTATYVVPLCGHPMSCLNYF